uniref:Uncharacterized protein n=1 Tax=Anguilla anguilla TaxID=7936 RepID=A0A0E9XUT6_ANGAN
MFVYSYYNSPVWFYVIFRMVQWSPIW